MNETEFETEVGKLLRDLGYTVRPTPPVSIHDVDLLLEMTSRRVAVQLRRWNAPP
jgi:Restriction endonuclease